jgi:hypothetical protein
MYPDDTGSILIELRRHHDTNAQCDNKEFLVTRRLTRLPGVLITKKFGTYREAVGYWDEQVAKVSDTGLMRRDSKIIGWHEEG